MPPGLVRDGAPHQFCCAGCETAYAVIYSCGLDAYYTLLERIDDKTAPPRSSRRTYADYDDPAFHALYCRRCPDGLLETELLLEGVHCAACVWLVERLPRIVPGVIESRLNLRRAGVRITFDPSVVSLSRVARGLESLGYTPHPARGAWAAPVRRAEDRRMMIRIAIAGACAGNIMLLYFALYAGMFEGIERGHEQLFRWTAMLLNTICLVWPGTVFLRGAWAALRARTIHLDVPIALGLYLGGVWGIWKTVAGSGDIYFDSISALVFFLLVGRFIQQRQQRYAADAVELLFSLTPSVARRVDPEGVRDVPAESLAVGDMIEIRAGDALPADGVVLAGETSMDVSLLTGESRPIRSAAGDSVAAGAVNMSSVIRVRVEATGEHTRIGRLMRTVEEATRRRAAIVRLADRWGARLLWILLGLSVITLAVWWHKGPAVAFDRAAALLIATCPCGLGLATPLAMAVAIGRAARRGILIKGGDVLQSLSKAGRRGVILLDKTGTLTMGRLSLVWWRGDENAKALGAALESCSAHPVALALLRDLKVERLAPVSDPQQHPGMGISGTVADHHVVVGTRGLLDQFGIEIGKADDDAAFKALREGLSPVFIGVDGRCVAVAALGDPLRPDAPAAIRRLCRLGWDVRILSGDHPELVLAVGKELHLDPAFCRGAVSPEDKLALVRELAESAPVVMVGDGVNDAGALAAATVGIAVRGGAEASLAAADVSLTREGLTPVLELLDGASAVMRTIRMTIAASLAYNVVAAALSIAGLISPLLAAIIMPASSLTVLAICVRSPAFRSPRHPEARR